MLGYFLLFTFFLLFTHFILILSPLKCFKTIPLKKHPLETRSQLSTMTFSTFLYLHDFTHSHIKLLSSHINYS